MVMLIAGRIGYGQARNSFLSAWAGNAALQIWRVFPILDYGKKWDFD